MNPILPMHIAQCYSDYRFPKIISKHENHIIININGIDINIHYSLLTLNVSNIVHINMFYLLLHIDRNPKFPMIQNKHNSGLLGNPARKSNNPDTVFDDIPNTGFR